MTAAAVLVLRVAVGTAFLLAVAGKLRDLAAFGQAVSGLLGTTAAASRLLAAAVVVAEALTAGLLLAWPPAAPVAFGLGGALLVAFSAVLVGGLRRPLAPSCRCFGGSERPVSHWDLVRNALLLAAAVAGAALAAGRAPAPLPPGDLLLAAMPGVALGMLLAHLHDVVTMLGAPTRLWR